MPIQRSSSEYSIPHLDIGKNELVIEMGFLLENGVEYLAIINKNGKIEDAIYKNDIKLVKEKKEMFSLGLVLQNSMQRDFDEEFGEVNYTITDRQNSKFVSIPTYAGILLVKLGKSIDPFIFINKISGILKFSEKKVTTH